MSAVSFSKTSTSIHINTRSERPAFPEGESSYFSNEPGEGLQLATSHSFAALQHSNMNSTSQIIPTEQSEMQKVNQEYELLLFAGHGNLEQVKKLLNRGVNINTSNYLKATEQRRFYPDPASLLSREPISLENPLIRAVLKGHEEVVSYLVEHNASLKALCIYAMNPLSIEIFKQLIDQLPIRKISELKNDLKIFCCIHPNIDIVMGLIQDAELTLIKAQTQINVLQAKKILLGYGKRDEPGEAFQECSDSSRSRVFNNIRSARYDFLEEKNGYLPSGEPGETL